MKEINSHDYKFWVDAADNLIKGLPKFLSAIKTLENKGYTYQGGEFWKPPVNKPNPLITDVKLRNEIKAQGIEEATNIGYSYCIDYTPEQAIRNYRKALQAYAKQLRAKHD